MASPHLNPLFSPDTIKDAIESGHLILTPNFRLARKIEEAWQLDQIQSGIKSWLRPNILALEGWFDQLWHQLLDSAYDRALAGAPLSPEKERWFWETVIAGDNSLAANINPDSFIDIARKGWQLLHQWQVDTDTLNRYDHSGLSHLIDWGQAVEREISASGYISSTARLATIEASFREDWLNPVDKIVLTGFQTLPPRVKAILSLATQALVSAPLGHRPAGTKHLVPAQNIDEEISAAARWADNLRQQDPAARIGIVIPQLSALKDRVERIFLHQLEPTWCLPNVTYREPPYNISAGVPLAGTPMIATALELTRLLSEPLDVSQLCLLLKNPFWGSYVAEGEMRCSLIRALLELGFHEISGATLRALVHQIESSEYGIIGDGVAEESPVDESNVEETNTKEKSLVQRLLKLVTLERTLPKKAGLGEWRIFIEEALAILGWPGSRTLDSLEYQQFQHWQSLLDDFAGLASISGQVSLGRALKILKTLTADCTFHEETADTNIQILGLLEAAGLEFDHLWVMNMDDRQWPQTTAPHPLIPVSLQRELTMPRACPQQELRLSRDMIQLFASSTDNLVLSYSRFDGDIECQPSPLVAEIVNLPSASAHSPDAAIADDNPHHPWLAELRNSAELEVIEDDRGPAFSVSEGYLKGGSRILADQAQCPFNAFARWRLGAEPLATLQTGISAQTRGQLVHSCMESIWFRLQDSKGLAALSDADLEPVIAAAVTRSIQQLLRNYGETISSRQLGDRLLQLEQERLHRLLLQWLNEERQRPEFKALELEKQVNLIIADLRISLRLDRIDQLPDGKLVVIDYKTGASTSLSGLSQERLVEPQLPLYGLAVEQEFGRQPFALAYGVINPKFLGFRGLTADPEVFPPCKGLTALGLPEDWQDALLGWRQTAAAIIDEFRSGAANLNFYSQNALNYSAHLLPLNRLATQAGLQDCGPDLHPDLQYQTPENRDKGA